jgi:hypothetical protein
MMSKVHAAKSAICIQVPSSKVAAIFSTWCQSASCFQYLVPKCQLFSVSGAKVPAVFSSWCQSASYIQYLMPKCQLLSVPGAKVPGSVRLGAGHVAGMEDISTGQLHAHQAPVGRVPAHIQLYFTPCCACTGSVFATYLTTVMLSRS